jgi:hypothetical protein
MSYLIRCTVATMRPNQELAWSLLLLLCLVAGALADADHHLPFVSGFAAAPLPATLIAHHRPPPPPTGIIQVV